MKNDDRPPAGLPWGERRDAEPSPARAGKNDMKGLFAATVPGSAAAPLPEASAPAADSGGDDAVTQLFGGQPMPAPELEEHAAVNEAELSRLDAAKSHGLLNDRWSTAATPPPAAGVAAIPMGVAANDAPKPPRPVAKLTLAGAGVVAPPLSAASATTSGSVSVALPSPPAAAEPPASFGLDRTLLAVAAPSVEPSRAKADAPAAAPAQAKRQPAAPQAARVEEAKPAASTDKGKAAPPLKTKKKRAEPEERAEKPEKHAPPPLPSAGTGRRARGLVLAGVGLAVVCAAALAGAFAGLYPLPGALGPLLGLEATADTTTANAGPAAAATQTPAMAPAAAKAAAPAKPSVAASPAAKASPAAAVVAKTTTEATKASTATPKPAAAPAPTAKTAPLPTPASPSDDPEELLAAARKALNGGDAALAATLCQGVLARDPSEHHAMEVLARALIAQGRGADALGYAQQIVKKRPKRASYRLIEGDARRLVGDTQGAVSAYREGLALDPGDRELRARLAKP